eukprot:Trichotokara_eunicae@DN378_c0_g1_i1.p1
MELDMLCFQDPWYKCRVCDGTTRCVYPRDTQVSGAKYCTPQWDPCKWDSWGASQGKPPPWSPPDFNPIATAEEEATEEEEEEEETDDPDWEGTGDNPEEQPLCHEKVQRFPRIIIRPEEDSASQGL